MMERDILDEDELITYKDRAFASAMEGLDKPSSHIEPDDDTLFDDKQAIIAFDDVPLAPELLTQPYYFNFYQAVLVVLWIIERANWVRRIRFKAVNSLAFPPSDLVDVTIPPTPDQPLEMTVSFLGLVTHGTILPMPYMDYILSEHYAGEEALIDFLDILNDRIISLLVKGKLHRKLALSLQAQSISPITRFLSYLSGPYTPIGLNEKEQFLTIETITNTTQEKATSLVWPRLLLLSSLLARRHPSITSLSRLCHAYTGLTIQIEEFQGAWRPLKKSDISVLGKSGQNQQLGYELTLGHKVWLEGAGLKIILSTNEKVSSMKWLTDSVRLINLIELINLHLGDQSISFALFFIVKQYELKPLKLTSMVKTPREEDRQLLGITTILYSKIAPETVICSLSYHQLCHIIKKNS